MGFLTKHHNYITEEFKQSNRDLITAFFKLPFDHVILKQCSCNLKNISGSIALLMTQVVLCHRISYMIDALMHCLFI